MKTLLVTVVSALALGTIAGCDRNSPEQRPAATPPSQAGTGASTVPQSNTPSTPANLGKPSDGEKSPMAQPPVQGREDVRQPEQRRDFQQKGDAAGPKSGG
jgi:predicted small lipoprotein YifL